jgi:uncharacterized protein YbdZ (MbtH family)
MATYGEMVFYLAENKEDVTVLWDYLKKRLPKGWKDLEIPEDELEAASQRLDATWTRTLKILEYKRELRHETNY